MTNPEEGTNSFDLAKVTISLAGFERVRREGIGRQERIQRVAARMKTLPTQEFKGAEGQLAELRTEDSVTSRVIGEIFKVPEGFTSWSSYFEDMAAAKIMAEEPQQ